MCGIFPAAGWPCETTQGHLCEASHLPGHEGRKSTTGSQQLLGWPTLDHATGVHDKDT